MTMNRLAAEEWRDYLNETDPVAREMQYRKYLNALMTPAADDEDLDKYAETLPIGVQPAA